MNVASASVEAAHITLRQPVPELRPYLGCFWTVETRPATRLRSVPDSCAALTIESREGVPPDCQFIGPRLAPAERTPGAGWTLLGVRLLPGVAHLLTGISAQRVAGRRVRLSELLPREAHTLDAKLATEPRAAGRLDLLEGFLLQHVAGKEVDQRVQDALERIACSEGQIRIVELASVCGISSRHLDRLLRKWVGHSPKQLARIVRFQTYLKQMETSSSIHLAELAQDLGYFDQAHLTNDAEKLAGSTPGRMAADGMAGFSKTRCE